MQVPAPFEYARAASVEDALALLERLGPEARVIAGGHSLLPMMKLRLAAPEHLIDINDLRDLAYVREEAGEIRIGALTRHRELLESSLLGERFPIFHDAERVIADPLVRNRGTIGGALCQADPSEDLSAVCAAVHARAVIRGAGGERVVEMDEFHRGPYETAVRDGELLTEVRIPLGHHTGSAFEKVERRAGDWAVAAVGVCVWMADGTIGDAGIGLSAVGSSAVRAGRAEDALKGERPSEDLFAAAGALAAADCSPADDQRGPADYKRHLAGELTQRALRRAVARALTR
jgi:carbon-monoxide dehydrogenase medium subunit